MIGQTVSHYRILEKLGDGGMGVVYKAEDMRLERFVALKFLRDELAADPMAIERLKREARAASALNHPNICTIYDIGSHEGHWFIAIELLEGQTLKERMQGGPLPMGEVLDFGIQIAEALDRAHAKGIIHRDIKPANLFITRDRQAKILDFGLGKLVTPPGGLAAGTSMLLRTRNGSDNDLTNPGATVGTIAYMSPEQARGDELDIRTDLFSFGAVLYEMVTGQQAFSGKSSVLVFDAILHAEPLPPWILNPQFPMEIERILSKALEKDRELRYQNAAEIRADLKRRKRDGESSSMNALRIAPSTPVPPAAKRPPFWKLSLKAVVAILSALLVGLAVFSFIQDRETTRGIAILQIRPLTSLPGLEIDPALSRDGKMLAYSGGTQARTDIYVRQVAGGNLINLTEGLPGNHRWPQWSPDESRIAFQSILPGGASSISIVPSLGGISKKLVDTPRAQQPVYSVPQLTGHTWSPDGNTMAYAQGNVIYTVATVGGDPKKIAELQAPHSLTWSPDGSRIAYVSGNATFVFGSALFANLAPSSIGLIDVAGGHAITVTDSTYVNVSPVWMPDSRSILYISSRGGDRDVYLLAIGASGKPSQPPQRLTTGLNAHTIGRSGDGKLLAYSALTTQSNIWSIPIPEHGPVSASEAKPVTTGNQTIEGISASRHEPLLAFDSNRSGNQDIYRMRLPGGMSEQLTTHASDDFLPSWSPDGKSLAFYSFRNGSRDLFVMTADGGHQQQLTSDPAQERYPDWSPDGARIVFYSDKTGREELYLISRKSDGSGWNMPRQLTMTGGIWPRWAPDGSLIAYIQNGLRVIDPETGRDRLLVSNRDTLRPQFATWSNDSRTVYFKSADAENHASFWSVPAGGGEPRLLVRFDDSARPSYRPEFATDGRNFFFTLAERESDIRMMELAN